MPELEKQDHLQNVQDFINFAGDHIAEAKMLADGFSLDGDTIDHVQAALIRARMRIDDALRATVEL